MQKWGWRCSAESCPSSSFHWGGTADFFPTEWCLFSIDLAGEAAVPGPPTETEPALQGIFSWASNLSPDTAPQPCALAAALSSEWDSRKGRLCNNCLEPLEYPWVLTQRERSWCQSPTCEHEPIQVECLAISCPPGHELQVPAGNSPPLHFSPTLPRVTNETHKWDASAAGVSVCVASPFLGSAKSCPPQPHCSAWAGGMAHGLDPLCDSLHLFFRLPETPPVPPLLANRVPHIWLNILETFSSGCPVMMSHSAIMLMSKGTQE